jgi:hypothetical protein
MHYSTLNGAAVLLALTSSAMAVGSATVINNCDFPVYYASVAQNVHAGMQLLSGSYSEAYSKPGVGVSIKLSPSQSGPVSQFEFTWADSSIYYDLSNIDGSPFANAGMSLVPSVGSDSAHPTCQAVTCAAGEAVCSAAYNQPDDVRTTVCSDQTSLTLTLCPGGSGSGTPSTSTPTTSSPSQTSATLTAPTWAHRFHPRHLPKRA